MGYCMYIVFLVGKKHGYMIYQDVFCILRSECNKAMVIIPIIRSGFYGMWLVGFDQHSPKQCSKPIDFR